MTTKTVAQILRSALRSTGWSQHALAVRAGLDDKRVSLLLSGKMPLRIETALALEPCLGLACVRSALEAQLFFDLKAARAAAKLAK